ncbi:hypothetical protein T265_15761, partial [Opisthorchis viverrini]
MSYQTNQHMRQTAEAILILLPSQNAGLDVSCIGETRTNGVLHEVPPYSDQNLIRLPGISQSFLAYYGFIFYTQYYPLPLTQHTNKQRTRHASGETHGPVYQLKPDSLRIESGKQNTRSSVAFR